MTNLKIKRFFFVIIICGILSASICVPLEYIGVRFITSDRKVEIDLNTGMKREISRYFLLPIEKTRYIESPVFGEKTRCYAGENWVTVHRDVRYNFFFTPFIQYTYGYLGSQHSKAENYIQLGEKTTNEIREKIAKEIIILWNSPDYKENVDKYLDSMMNLYLEKGRIYDTKSTPSQ